MTAPATHGRPSGRPTIARLSIAPVRGLGLQHPSSVVLERPGVAEDRRFYLIDDDGHIVDRLSIGALVQISATTSREADALTLAFPDGRIVRGEVRLGSAVVTSIYGADTHGRIVDGPWSQAISAFAGRSIRLVRCDSPGGTRAEGSVSLLGDGSLDRLAQQLGVETIDARRFRMLIYLSNCRPHEEDGWLGRRVSMGESVIRVINPLARCAITTQDPDTGSRDLDTIRAIIAYRGLRDSRDADFGVVAEVEQTGVVRVGDVVEPIGEDRAL